MLDGLNRYRLDREPSLLAAWETAQHVVTGGGASGGDGRSPGHADTTWYTDNVT